MIRIWDGFLSSLCAAITASAIGAPLWAAYRAVDTGLVPTWMWAPMIVLGFIGVILLLAFLRKAFRGVHPLRERRR